MKKLNLKLTTRRSNSDIWVELPEFTKQILCKNTNVEVLRPNFDTKPRLCKIQIKSYEPETIQ